MKITGSILLFISPDKMNSAINNPDSQVYPFTDKLLVDSSGRLICSKDRHTGKTLLHWRVTGTLTGITCPLTPGTCRETIWCPRYLWSILTCTL